MYIPTIFFGGSDLCTNLIPSQSTFPTGSTLYGQLGPQGTGSDESYFFVRCNPGEAVNFVIQGGTTSAAKLLLIGGGGGADELSEGGGAAGDVIFEDIPLSPGNYFLSSSAFNGSGSVQAGSSAFVTNVNDIPAHQTTYIALGGNNGSSANGATNTNFTGGTGATGQGGGGGAGSRGNGTNASGNDGGDGGTPFTVPSPFSQVTGKGLPSSAATEIAGGGGGKGQCGDTDGVGYAFNEYGSGGSYDFNPSCVGGARSGMHGAAFLFIPIQRCALPPSGAIDLPSEQGVADGGDIVGTFTSGSDTFKYHIFTTVDDGAAQPDTGIFSVKTGSIQDAKILAVGGGGGGGANSGGGGSGGITINKEATLYGMYRARIGGSGSVASNGGVSSLQPISSFVTYQYAEGGGAGPPSAGVAQSGGSGGGGGGATSNPGNALSGSSQPSFNSAQFFYGSKGGTGGGGFNQYGGGGGGATSNGLTGGPSGGTLPNGGDGFLMTGEFFPTNVWVTGSIARGGDGGSVVGGSHPIQPGSGDGGHGGGLGSPNTGSNGFLSITYKI